VEDFHLPFSTNLENSISHEKVNWSYLTTLASLEIVATSKKSWTPNDFCYSCCCSTIFAIYSNLYVVPSIAMVLLLIYYELHLLLYITLLLLPPLVNYWTPSASTFACALLLQLYCYCYWCYFILLLLPPLTTHQFFKATKLWRNKQQKFLTIYYCFHLSPLTNVFKQPHLHTILTRLNLVHSTKYMHNAHKLMLKISCSLCLSIFNGPTHFLAFNS
jgi:hypothetical protein